MRCYEGILKLTPGDAKTAEALRRAKGRIDDTAARARKSMEDGRIAAAVDAYEALVKYTPTDAQAVKGLQDARAKAVSETVRLIEKARDAIASGEVSGAAVSVARALEISPHNEEALALRSKVASKTKDLVQRYVKEGNSYIDSGQLDKASDVFRAALLLDPDNQEALKGMDRPRLL